MKNFKYVFLLYGFLHIAVCVSAPVAVVPVLLTGTVKDWTSTLDRIERATQKPDVSDDMLEELRPELNALRAQVLSAIDEAAPESRHINDELNALGPPPAAGAPKELPDITAKRKAISDELATIDGANKEAGLLVTRIDHIFLEISAIRRNRFAERILSRSQTPLSPALWKKVAAECLADWKQFSASLQNFGTSLALQAADYSHMAIMLGAGTLLIVALFNWLKRWIVARATTLEGEPSQGQRLKFALIMGLIRALAPSSVVLSLYLALRSTGILPDSVQGLISVSVTSLLSIFLIAAFCRSVLTPFSPRWRLVGSSTRGSRSVSRVIIAGAVIFALDRVFDELRILYAASLELTVIQKFISGLSITAVLLLFLKQPFWQQEPTISAPPSILGSRAWGWLRGVLYILVLAIPLSAALGYVALSRLMATQIVLTLGLFLGGALTRSVLAETIRHVLTPETEAAIDSQGATAIDDNDAGEMQIFWATAFANLLLVIAAFFALLLIWGAGGHDFRTWLYQAFFGIKVGSLTISPADILFAGLLFLALNFFTRFFQRTLEQSVFPKTRLDVGIRNSIRASIGYVGFVIASLMAASAIGVNLSSLAIIAGALSVGIGFGLQNIINNFVSGLILLIERPIKVGDLVVVGEYQGHVRKISVRATELTTFDRASVFIPNSELIASPVMNRTHADRDGRIVIPVGIAYGSDTVKVRDLLLDIARQHPGVKINPAPGVLFRAFGSDALQFELIAYIFDVDSVMSITSDLCFSIDNVLREHNVAIPFPQREVRLGLQEKQLDALLNAISARQGEST